MQWDDVPAHETVHERLRNEKHGLGARTKSPVHFLEELVLARLPVRWIRDHHVRLERSEQRFFEQRMVVLEKVPVYEV